jgi:ankyrin repeat protein
MRRKRRGLRWTGIALVLLLTTCCVHSVQGPVWGRVELADGAALDDVVVHLYCRSHALHGSFTAGSAYRVVGAGQRFVFPWTWSGPFPTGCSLRVVHPLYQQAYASFDKGLAEELAPITLQTWEDVLRRAEAGEDVEPLSVADMNRHVFDVRHYFVEAHRKHPERVAPYVPELHRAYDRGLRFLPAMNRDRFGGTQYSLDALRDIERESGYLRPPAQRELFEAARAGDAGRAAAALAAGADPDGWDVDGAAALHLAAGEGHVEVVERLLDGGARIDRQREGLGNSALLDAVLEHQVETALVLIERGADVALGAHGRTPISAAARGGDRRIFLALVERGALAKPGDAALALQNASRTGRVDLVELLLERGVPADASFGVGWTALMLAALEGEPDTARVLIEAGADVNARATDGRTPLAMARQADPAPRRRAEVLALLEASGARE